MLQPLSNTLLLCEGTSKELRLHLKLQFHTLEEFVGMEAYSAHRAAGGRGGVFLALPPGIHAPED